MMALSSVTRTSSALKWAVVLLWLLTLIIGMLRWAAEKPAAWLPPTLAAHVGTDTLTPAIRFTCFMVELVPLAAAYYAIAALYRICEAYAKGNIFKRETGVQYRRFGRGLFLLGGANAVYTSLLSAILSGSTGSGKLAISVGLSTADLYLLIVGCAVMMLGVVMDEASRIHDENAEII